MDNSTAQGRQSSVQAFSFCFPLSQRQPQLVDDQSLLQHLQDYLAHSSLPTAGFDYRNNGALASVLATELDTPALDEMHDYLHFVSPRNFTRIDPLHRFHIKKMQVVIAEDPGLHLIWYYDTIFIKPIPSFLLSFKMWTDCLLPATVPNSQQGVAPGTSTLQNQYSTDLLSYHCKSALGFLRTYAFLVRHLSDFEIARGLRLVPQDVSYADFRAYVDPFRSLPDEAVAARYHFGQMRLTRLNWAVRLLQPRSVRAGGWFANRLWYLELGTQSSAYVRDWLPPLLFAFAVLSLVLSAMQVMLANTEASTWGAFPRVSWRFSVGTVVFCTSASVVLLSYFPIMLAGQMIYATRGRGGRASPA